jgi:mannose-6-phosphate isomerase-like protein (cupin superfamily)
MTPLSEEKLDVVHHFVGGIYAKEMTLKTMGDGMHQHRHHFDHMSILAEGSVWVEVDGVRTQHTAPAVLNIRAGERHKIWPITSPVKWYCIHATDCEDPAEVDNVIVSEREE